MNSIQNGLHQPGIVESALEGDAAHARASDSWQGHWPDESAAADFARRLANCPALAQAVIALHGDLGAGKTTLVRHLLRALGVEGRIKSPTYAVVEPHQSSDCAWMPPGDTLSIWHFDFYRFADPREWEDAGFRELFASPGLKLVEWPERAQGVMPAADLDIEIRSPSPAMDPAPEHQTDDQRQVLVRAASARGRQLMQALS